MSDAVSSMSERDFADLCALADGSLPAERRAEVEARVAASPELQELVDRQRKAVARTQALESEPVPASLEAAIEKQRRPRARRRPLSGLVPRLGLASGLAAGAAILVLVLSGGSAAPTVADAASVAIPPPSGPAPHRSDGSRTRLAVDVEGVSFPDFLRAFGWRAVGVRHAKLDGRGATVVSYAKGRRRIAYVIVGDGSLDRPHGTRDSVRGGVPYQGLRLNGRQTVTWRRGGHTCVLIGQATLAELSDLASY